jgi:hypothetical protein
MAFAAACSGRPAAKMLTSMGIDVPCLSSAG